LKTEENQENSCQDGRSHDLQDFTYTYFTQLTQGNETLFPNWQKELWQTFEKTSGYVRPERVNKWPNSMTDM
jgi:hypothetical protein